jgi:CubicO group peptidase (beta-lactamase class C family)
MRLLRFTGFLLALAAILIPASAQTTDRYHQKLQPILEKMVRDQELPGLAIGVVEENRLVYAAAFGTQNISHKDDPVTTRSLFHMASITKLFVATSIMELVEQGRIDLDAPLIKYLQYFRMADDRYKIITIRQMVTHSSGMPDVEDYEWDKPQYDAGALERYVRSLSNLKLEFAPGQKFQYSNIAFEILGDVIAKVSGESFDDYVQNHILTPLGMKDSTLLVKQANPKLLAWGHELDGNGNPFPSKVYPYNRIHSPSSDLHSNVADMSRWAIANMNRGELDGKRILKASTYDLLWKRSGELGGKPSPVGISWFIGEMRGEKMVSHNGGDTGFLTGFAMLPERKIAVVWMVNDDWLPNGGGITRDALKTALGFDPQPITGKRSLARAVISIHGNQGIDAAIAAVATLKRLHPDQYNFTVGQLNGAGQYLIHSGHAADAVRIFQLNLQTYPDSAAAYDGLGTAYETTGRRDLAIANYERAVAMDPKTAHAAEALKRLKP